MKILSLISHSSYFWAHSCFLFPKETLPTITDRTSISLFANSLLCFTVELVLQSNIHTNRSLIGSLHHQCYYSCTFGQVSILPCLNYSRPQSQNSSRPIYELAAKVSNSIDMAIISPNILSYKDLPTVTFVLMLAWTEYISASCHMTGAWI